MDRIIRHTKKKVVINDIVVPTPLPDKSELCVSRPPSGKKKVKNIYYDPDTAEIVLEIEE